MLSRSQITENLIATIAYQLRMPFICPLQFTLESCTKTRCQMTARTATQQCCTPYLEDITSTQNLNIQIFKGANVQVMSFTVYMLQTRTIFLTTCTQLVLKLSTNILSFRKSSGHRHRPAILRKYTRYASIEAVQKQTMEIRLFKGTNKVINSWYKNALSLKLKVKFIYPVDQN